MSTDSVSVLRDSLHKYAAAKNRHDIEAILAAYTPDGYYLDPTVGQPVSGHSQLRQFYTEVFRSIPDYNGHFAGAAFGKNTAVVWGRMTGTVGTELLGVATTPGSRLDVPVTFVCTFRDGQLISDTGYYDTRVLHEQAGVRLAETQPRPSEIESFVAGWARFWAAPDDISGVHDLITDDVALHWPGTTEPLRGREAYTGQLAAAVQVIPDLTLSVVDYACRDGRLILAWQGHGTIDGQMRHWPGVDRFRLDGGRSAETTVVFDTRAVIPATPAEHH
ncbi:nuclear transport factor 2 family protein [Mycobacterium sp. 21AC1]|uniref:nuclear transport factor 2 family protein n=1 Tax=[Mycobacterium] appelbergii TaxID=2939269 RepID=UPI00293904B2|nr:nuclear transport factor 2 family protein [Mycobacterium sp. 21AC1]MDV3126727.1 nuclear transport factor 2 family protein [Mycobacterium sp. 21AC1]